MKESIYKELITIKRDGYGNDFKKINGNQDIPVVNYDNRFKKLLMNNFEDFKMCLESNTYDKAPKGKNIKLNLTSGTWGHSSYFHSFCHILFGIVEHYNIRKIYEIGTYMGGSTMMIMNYFNKNNIVNYKIDILFN